MRGPIRRASWPYRIATNEQRALPELIVIGAQRSGTTALYRYLAANPAVGRSHLKEVRYFDTNYQRGVSWYRAHFPRRRELDSQAEALGTRAIAMEASPNYLLHPLGPHRVRALLPQVKLVALLRDPVDRAISHYHLSLRKGVERLPIAEALEAEPERLAGEHERLLAIPLYDGFNHRHFSYVERGKYAEQLERWFEVFPRDQLLVLDTADLFVDPDRTVRRICDFAGLTHQPLPSYNVRAAKAYDDYSPVRERLRECFRPHNEHLRALLDEGLSWA